MKDADAGSQEKEQEPKEKKNLLEWAVFALSLLLLLGVFGYLGYYAFHHQSTPPELVVETTPAPSPHSPYRYHVVVHNRGGSTAEEVQLEFLMKKDSAVLGKAQLQIPFAPQSSKREGWIIFSTDPAKADTIVASVLGYKKP
jgi:uncharacterized protein (TIGR02588 family)